MTAELTFADTAARPSQIDARYALRHPLQMALCLRGLVARRDFLVAGFEGGQIVTQLLDVDSRRARFVFDYGGARSDNAALAAADSLTFRSHPGGIRTEFVTGRATPVSFEGRPAFEAAFPALLYFVQRREFHRVETPVGEPFVASGIDAEGEPFDLDLQDMSLGGIALRTSDPRFAALPRGTVWNDVTLQMGAFSLVTVHLEIVAPRQAITPSGEARTVLGCRFNDLSGRAERTLQRVITQLESRNLRTAGR
ncbi:flagellar brake protein [Caballeronia sp. LZ035]|uniref:flagellar brake protein n=1 Tax=Caballeronia sp. LZ035 TaxID=3038568 RepID=UPI00285C3FCE|nr:flagellar brake protein [Caballeronia sp. LZ035]MDR5759527.1 flagellar brake protein [Caballeronia sp. LZ035]